jgi:CRP-like cAMP-binding protein
MLGFSAVRVGGVAAKLKRRAKIKLKARAVLAKNPEDRTEEDIDSIVSLTNRSSYFWNMQPELQRSICKVLQLETCDPYTVIMKEGDVPTSDAKFYIVLAGQVSVYQWPNEESKQNATPPPSRPSTAKSERSTTNEDSQLKKKYGDFQIRLGAGKHFGERALLSSEARSATIVTFKTKTELLFLTRKDYDRLLASKDRAKLREIKDALGACLRAAATAGFGEGNTGDTTTETKSSDISKLTYYVEWKKVPDGEAIAQQDAPADRLIFLVEGQALVQHTVRKPPLGKLELVNISKLREFSTFGASEFVRPVPTGKKNPTYKMTLRACGLCRYLSLSRVHLQRIQKNLSRLLLKCAAVSAMRNLFWFHRLAMYKDLPGHKESFNSQKLGSNLPETHDELFRIVEAAMRQAAHKNIALTKRPGKQAHKVSTLAHHAWPFKNSNYQTNNQSQKRKKKSQSVSASFEQIYEDDINMVWAKTVRKSKIEHSSTASNSSKKERIKNIQRMISSLCAKGSFELLQSAADDAARRATMHVNGGVVSSGLLNQTSNDLCCCSPVKATRNRLDRITDRESEIEAELKGLDAMLEARGYKTSITLDTLERGNETESKLDQSPKGLTMLQPHIPHVLHDLPQIFGQAKIRRNHLVVPIATRDKLHGIPESFKVLWPRPKVTVPHYSSASPALLTKFITSLSEDLL